MATPERTNMQATYFGENIEIVGCSFDEDGSIARVHFKNYSQYRKEFCGATQYSSLMDVKAEGSQEELNKFLQTFNNSERTKEMKTATTGSAKHSPAIKDKTLKELADIYNSKVSKNERIKAFRDRSTALRRIAEINSAKPSRGNRMNESQLKTPELKLVGKKSSLAGKYLYKLAKINPRRAGTHGWKSYEVLKDGMTYEQFTAAKGGSKHLLHDIEKGWVEARDKPKA